MVERGPELGGLAGTFEQDGHFYPLAYHHILHLDRPLLYFLDQVGALDGYLGDELPHRSGVEDAVVELVHHLVEVHHHGAETAVGAVAGEHPGGLEHRERSVERRKRDRIGKSVLDLGCRARSLRLGNGLECCPAASGEPDSLRGETLADGLFEMLHYPASLDTVH